MTIEYDVRVHVILKLKNLPTNVNIQTFPLIQYLIYYELQTV